MIKHLNMSFELYTAISLQWLESMKNARILWVYLMKNGKNLLPLRPKSASKTDKVVDKTYSSDVRNEKGFNNMVQFLSLLKVLLLNQ